MNCRSFHRARLGFILATVTALIACGDYSVRLPGGYKLVRLYAGAIVISHPDKGIVIDANIDGYDVYGGMVIGHVTTSELPPESEFSKPGYFILDSKTGELTQGLDYATWLTTVNSHGLVVQPDLKEPSRFDRNY